MQRSDRRTRKNGQESLSALIPLLCVHCNLGPLPIYGVVKPSRPPIHVSQVLWVSNPHSLTSSCDPGVTAHLGCLNHSSPFLASLNLGLEELKVTQKFKHLKTQNINS